LSSLSLLELAAPWRRFSIPIGVVNVLVDINLHPLLGADDVSGNVVVGGQYQTFCCWTSLNMCMTIIVVHSAPQFCFWSFSLGLCFLFFMLVDWFLRYEIPRTLFITSSLHSFSLVWIVKYGEILSTQEHIYFDLRTVLIVWVSILRLSPHFRTWVTRYGVTFLWCMQATSHEKKSEL
jgi:hypothetical protein